MQAAHEKKVALRNPIAGFSPSQQVRFFITFKLNPRRVRAALTRRGPWPGGDHVLRGDRQKSPGLCNREHIAPKPLSMDYDGSDCTCIHSPSSVSLIHLFFMGPLTFSYKPAHSLTYSQLLSSTRSSFPSLPVSPLLTSLRLTSRFTKRYEYLLTTRDQTAAFCPCARAENTRFETFFFFPSQRHVPPQHPAVSIWVHRHTSRAEGPAYLCYWFSHWLRSSFGKWKHAVSRKRDLELETSACP